MDCASFVEQLQHDKFYPMAQKWRADFLDLYRQNDARVHWFVGVARMTNNLKLGYLSTLYWSRIESWKPGCRPAESEMREFETFVLWGFVHGLSTTTEETLRLIWAALGQNETTNISSIHNSLLTMTGLKPRYEELFKLFRLLRNMCHNNGFHLPSFGGDEEVEWRNTKYKFLVGQDVSFISARFLVGVLTSDLCDAVDVMMRSEPICSLQLIKRRVVAPVVS